MREVAFLGLGAMGSRMAANLLSTGHDLTVWKNEHA
jgi:3-hydroxyisobutyrate dehydrogenase-like beta-hydroxyacid dehydrogenase